MDAVDWEVALAANGALEAALEARDEGLVRFIGVTGHGLPVAAMHRRSLERFPFDSVLLPYNRVQMQDARYAERFEALAEVCAARGVALQTIKSQASRPWDGRKATAATWYEPLREPADIELATHWVLGRPEASWSPPGTSRSSPTAGGGRALRARPPTSRWPSSWRARERAAVRVARPRYDPAGSRSSEQELMQ